MTRIDDTFARLKREGKKAFVSYIMGGDPDAATSMAVMQGLPAAGVDIIELGMPFTDPMADGPTIQLAGQRALEAGMTMDAVLDMVRTFRKGDTVTPIVLMGYYNPIYSRGVDRFLTEAVAAGIDGLIVVDLPPEEDDELCIPAQKAGINFIRLATPTTDAKRLPKVLQNTSGFVYYVSITGITGAAAAQAVDVAPEVARIKAATDLPIIVGFGITTPDTARAIAGVADGCVVGSAIVKDIGAGKPVAEVLANVAALAAGAHSACGRRQAASGKRRCSDRRMASECRSAVNPSIELPGAKAAMVARSASIAARPASAMLRPLGVSQRHFDRPSRGLGSNRTRPRVSSTVIVCDIVVLGQPKLSAMLAGVCPSPCHASRSSTVNCGAFNPLGSRASISRCAA